MCEFRGAPIDQIASNATLWDYPLPTIRANSYHRVMYQIPIDLNSAPKPHYNREETFNANVHVKLPYIDKGDSPPDSKPHWQVVEEALLQPIRNSRQLEAVVRSYLGLGSKFRALHYLFERIFTEEETDDFFENILPEIIQLALNLPNIIPANLPYLKSGSNKSISLSQYQISCLLANAFLCTYNHKRDRPAKVPGINFDRLFYEDPKKCVLEKLICIIHYFRRIIAEKPLGVVTFERKHIHESQLPRIDAEYEPFSKHKMHISSTGTIEDNGQGFLQVDFANKFIGGGVLGQGCVQEEIRFVICPELIISRLFTEELRSNEALLMIGAEQYSKYTGYGNTFKWAGRHVDRTPYDVTTGRRKTSIIAIDALPFHNTQAQYKTSCMKREIYKAYIGFHQYQSHSPNKDSPSPRLSPIATGNWGCGAFNGNPYLKFLIQLIAATMAKRDVVYFTFNDKELMEELWAMYLWIGQENVTVRRLWRLLCSIEPPSKNIFNEIKEAYLKSKLLPLVCKPPEYPKLNFKRATSSKTDTTQTSTSKDISNFSLDEIVPDDFEDYVMDTSEIEETSRKTLHHNDQTEKSKAKISKTENIVVENSSREYKDVVDIINVLHSDMNDKKVSTSISDKEKCDILSMSIKPNMSTSNELLEVVHVVDDDCPNTINKIVKKDLNTKITDYFRVIDKK